jgi:hypothetical protein
VIREGRTWIDGHPDEVRDGLLVIDGVSMTLDEAPHPFLIDYAMACYPELELLYPRITAGTRPREDHDGGA